MSQEPDLNKCPICGNELNQIEKLFAHVKKQPKPCGFDCEKELLRRLQEAAKKEGADGA